MFRIAITTAAAIAAMVFASSLAQAQQAPCGKRDKILSKLGKDYAEQPVSLGLSSNGTLVEVLASKSGSWTMIYTMPNGGCWVIATGQYWEDVAAKAGRPAA